MPSLISGLGRSPGGGHGNPRQYSCLENNTDRGAWRAAVHKSHKESDTTEATQHVAQLVIEQDHPGGQVEDGTWWGQEMKQRGQLKERPAKTAHS